MTLISFEVSLAVELIQLVTRVGSCDVDDMILNTLGGMLGFFCFKIVWFWNQKDYERVQSKKETIFETLFYRVAK